MFSLLLAVIVDTKGRLEKKQAQTYEELVVRALCGVRGASPGRGAAGAGATVPDGLLGPHGELLPGGWGRGLGPQ